MKTELTQQIEKALLTYYPKSLCGIELNKFRGFSLAYEVPVVNGNACGLVDCLRIDEYFSNIKEERVCYWYDYFHQQGGKNKDAYLKRNIELPRVQDCPHEITVENQVRVCDKTKCFYNKRCRQGECSILITCFEIKISKSDFKSKNGHNFVGNLNYYVMPKKLYDDIHYLIPEGIGVIVYYDGKDETKNYTTFCGLRKKKECEFRNLTDEDQKWFILSVLKKVRFSGQGHYLQ